MKEDDIPQRLHDKDSHSSSAFPVSVGSARAILALIVLLGLALLMIIAIQHFTM